MIVYTKGDKMKKCRMCGTHFVNDDYEYCPYCGSRVIFVSTKEEKEVKAEE